LRLYGRLNLQRKRTVRPLEAFDVAALLAPEIHHQPDIR
jgi:hypothetical protein